MELSYLKKNKNGVYETREGKLLSCGDRLKFERNEGELIEARVEHNGKDYYLFVSETEKHKINKKTVVLID